MKLVGDLPQLRDYGRENAQHYIVMMWPGMKESGVPFPPEPGFDLPFCRLNHVSNGVETQSGDQ